MEVYCTSKVNTLQLNTANNSWNTRIRPICSRLWPRLNSSRYPSMETLFCYTSVSIVIFRLFCCVTVQIHCCVFHCYANTVVSIVILFHCYALLGNPGMWHCPLLKAARPEQAPGTTPICLYEPPSSSL
jgi:hypothetical protein